MSENEESLFEKMGGVEGVQKLVEVFYDRVLADKELGPFFENVRMEKLLRMQTEFFSAALGGPGIYTGKPIGEIHAGRGITKQHLQRFVEHLLEVLKDQDLDENAVNAIYGRIAVHADEISGDGSEDG